MSNAKSPFKVSFDIYSYKDILPSLQEYLQHDVMLNEDARVNGRIDKMIWTRYIPTEQELDSPTFRQQEVRRILMTGAWIWIKDYPVWLPPSYYNALQYGITGEDPLQFRIKRLKLELFKIQARKNPECDGVFIIKNRQDGETTMEMHNSLWECADGIMNVGQMGIQSKTRDDAQNPCWMAAQTTWINYPKWLKDELYSDFISGDNIAEKFQFMRKTENGQLPRNVLFKYYPAVFNAMDGKNNMKKCILDEVLKWVECNFGDSLECYKRFIRPGFERKGLFSIFSSPPAFDCKSYRDGKAVWDDSNMDELIDYGNGVQTTKSRLHRYRSNPLEGIQGGYDIYGDADPDKIYYFIIKERKNCKKERLPQQVRDYALTEEETWGTLDGENKWSNTQGIKDRQVFLVNRRFKDPKTMEPCRVYGNLEWREGKIDTETDFRMEDIDHFDLNVARFCFAFLPQNKEALKYNWQSKPIPPLYIENVIGLDPFNHRYKTKDRPSDQGMVNRQFRDLFETGIINCPTMIYCCRPTHQEIAFEDALKAAVFCRALIQYENRNDKFENYAEDRGYSDWLLPSITSGSGSVTRKGDAPTGKGAFLDEGIGLLDAATNKPIDPNGKYNLEHYWFPELLSDYMKFNRENTQAANLTMADFQALIGAVKIMHRKMRQPSEVNDEVLNYLFG